MKVCMQRRQFVKSGVAVSALAIAGCSGGTNEETEQGGDAETGDQSSTYVSTGGSGSEQSDTSGSIGQQRTYNTTVDGVPQVLVEFEHVEGSAQEGNPDVGHLIVRHAGGDPLLVPEEISGDGGGYPRGLWIFGELAETVDVAESVDQTSQGPWQGEASAEIGGRPAVVEGDSNRLGVDSSDYEVDVAWRNGGKQGLYGSENGTGWRFE